MRGEWQLCVTVVMTEAVLCHSKAPTDQLLDIPLHKHARTRDAASTRNVAAEGMMQHLCGRGGAGRDDSAAAGADVGRGAGLGQDGALAEVPVLSGQERRIGAGDRRAVAAVGAVGVVRVAETWECMHTKLRAVPQTAVRCFIRTDLELACDTTTEIVFRWER